MSCKWYSGVPHIHSIASDDGKHTTFELSKVYEFGYNLIIGSKIPSQKGMKMPPFIYAQSGAIYFG